MDIWIFKNFLFIHFFFEKPNGMERRVRLTIASSLPSCLGQAEARAQVARIQELPPAASQT